MKRLNLESWLDQLGVVEEDRLKIFAEISADEPEPVNILARILAGIGAVLSVLLFSAFILLAGAWESKSALATMGVFMLFLGVAISRMSHTFFVEAICVTLFFLGNVLTGASMADEGQSTTICMLLIVINVINLFVARGYVMLFASVIAANAAMWWMMNDAEGGSSYFILQGLWLAFFGIWTVMETRLSSMKRAIHAYLPIRTAMAVTVLLSYWFFPRSSWREHSEWFYKAFAVFPAIAACWTVYRTCGRELGLSLISSWTVTMVLALLFLLLPVSPGVSASLYVLLLGFGVMDIVCVVMAGMALIVYLINMYYNLGISLLAKSGVMVLMGLAALALYWFFTRKTIEDEQG